MAPQVAALPKSESKARFLARLGLDIRLPLHRHLYTLMKAEASEGRRRIIHFMNHSASSQSAQRSGSSRSYAGSYSTSQVDTALLAAETARILHEAVPATRIIYNLAIDPANPSEPNWIITWLLWHVFRYRDGRSKLSVSQRDSFTLKADESDEDSRAAMTAAPGSIQQGPLGSGLWRYDAVRNIWNPVRYA